MTSSLVPGRQTDSAVKPLYPSLTEYLRNFTSALCIRTMKEISRVLEDRPTRVSYPSDSQNSRTIAASRSGSELARPPRTYVKLCPSVPFNRHPCRVAPDASRHSRLLNAAAVASTSASIRSRDSVRLIDGTGAGAAQPSADAATSARRTPPITERCLRNARQDPIVPKFAASLFGFFIEQFRLTWFLVPQLTDDAAPPVVVNR